ncbi:MAG: hypothetical protein A2057_10985 [Ignavibacteria bacterium GWA2_35_9]|nr:MAG: hypothetical protein A2057_10985 [Ignavibacteria bacterium GWA2_35_9]OGU47798.1 MAG: hypothetical protein A2000_09845 [Ignavibacteria bacterium GWB2_36_8]OGU49398.1 MAG: hypothetical protein A2080_11320 [Ignavibacteria bacterium GWC2_36_12]
MNLAAGNKLKKILSDNKSGSSEILLKLINWCKNYSSDKKTLLEMINASNKELKSFPAVQSFIREFKKVIETKGDSQIIVFLNEQTKRIENRYSNLFNNSLPILKDSERIVTLSNSKTIIEILERLNKLRKISVVVGESRPQFEGRIMAKELLKNKIKVEIIPDVLLLDAVEKADAAIIGADFILLNGNVVNKIGSRSLAIACKYLKKPFYVLATTDKASNKKKYFHEKRNGNEIWNYNHKFLTKTNYYFEIVEKKLITKVITG